MRVSWPIAVSVIVVTLALLGGCGGHDGQVGPGGGNPPPGVKTFVGQAVCVVCHAGPGGAYASSAHGKNFHDPASNGSNADLINGFGGACAPCHVTGFQEASGWTSSAATPHLDNIGCEECHGGGSLHAGAPGGSNIVALPAAQTTCWDCHVPSYKLLRAGEPAEVTDADFAGTAPGRINPHNRQAPFLMGYLGYRKAAMPSPHSAIENTCVTCHLNENTERKHGATGLGVDFVACAACHGSEAESEEKLEEFETEIDAALIEIGGADPSNPAEPDEGGTGGLLAAYAVDHGIDLVNNSNPNGPAVRNYKAALYNYKYVIGGYAVHNPPFAEQLLDDCKRMLQ